MKPGKTHYPAKFCHKLKRFPCKRCETCSKLLSPKIYGGFLEAVSMFSKRRFCDSVCMGKARRGKPPPGPAKKRTAAKQTTVAAPDRTPGSCELHGDYLHGPTGCPACAVARRARGKASDVTRVQL